MTERQIDRQADRQTDRQTVRQTERDKERQRQRHRLIGEQRRKPFQSQSRKFTEQHEDPN